MSACLVVLVPAAKLPTLAQSQLGESTATASAGWPEVTAPKAVSVIAIRRVRPAVVGMLVVWWEGATAVSVIVIRWGRSVVMRESAGWWDSATTVVSVIVIRRGQSAVLSILSAGWWGSIAAA